jgi:hypothetical protein
VFENRVMRGIFQPKTEKIKVGSKKLQTKEASQFVLLAKYY